MKKAGKFVQNSMKLLLPCQRDDYDWQDPPEQHEQLPYCRTRAATNNYCTIPFSYQPTDMTSSQEELLRHDGGESSADDGYGIAGSAENDLEEAKQTNNLRISRLILLPMKVFILTRRRREEGRMSPNEAGQPARKGLDSINAKVGGKAPQSTLPRQVSAPGQRKRD